MNDNDKPEIKPEEKDIPEIIKALKANIRDGIHLLNPDACFTKGQMRYLIEVLEKEQKNISKGR
jgi:hypothetical protein